MNVRSPWLLVLARRGRPIRAATQNELGHVATTVVMAVILSFGPTAVSHAESRFSGSRLVVGKHGPTLFHNDRFDDVEGVFVSDAEARRLRFEADGRVLFEAAYDQLTGLHYEESKYPSGPRRSRFYVAVHYSNTAGESDFAIVRLAQGAAPDVLAALERDTGLRIDRGPATTSFLGLPIHMALGDAVNITDDSGRRTKGRVTRLSVSSVELQPSRRFEPATIRKIEVRDPIWNGAFEGAAVFGLPFFHVMWNRSYCDSCSILPSFTAGLAVGAVVGALIDASLSRDAYRRSDRSASYRVQWAGGLTESGKGAQVSIHFALGR